MTPPPSATPPPHASSWTPPPNAAPRVDREPGDQNPPRPRTPLSSRRRSLSSAELRAKRRPRSEPDGRLSAHPALQRFSRAVRGWLPVVDGLVAGCADDEGLAPHFGHQGCPGGLLAAWLAGEVGELAGLVGFHRGAGVAPFAFAVQEPGDDLLRARGRCGLAVGDDRL